MDRVGRKRCLRISTGHMVLLFQSERHTVAFLISGSQHTSVQPLILFTIQRRRPKECVPAEEQKKAAKSVRREKSVWILKELPE